MYVFFKLFALTVHSLTNYGKFKLTTARPYVFVISLGPCVYNGYIDLWPVNTQAWDHQLTCNSHYVISTKCEESVLGWEGWAHSRSRLSPVWA